MDLLEKVLWSQTQCPISPRFWGCDVAPEMEFGVVGLLHWPHVLKSSQYVEDVNKPQ
jgi:hypothetical protein